MKTFWLAVFGGNAFAAGICFAELVGGGSQAYAWLLMLNLYGAYMYVRETTELKRDA